MNRRSFCYNMISLPAAASLATTRGWGERPAAGEPRKFDAVGEIRFVLQDRLDHPFYWWPKTLLTYPIELRQPVDLSRLILTDVATGTRLPIQFSSVSQNPNGSQTATLSFFSDLPTGARREFVLSSSASAAQLPSGVKETRDRDSIILDTGSMRVRIPATQLVHGDAPGPIMQLARGARWLGSSTLMLEGDKVTRITTSRIANGHLFIAYEVAYESANGSRYVARVQCTAGLDFVQLQEDMEGIRPGTHGTFKFNWIGFEATHRQSPNHPFPLPDQVMNYEDYTWEAIDSPWFKSDVRFGSSLPIYPEVLPEGQLPIFLGIYEPAPGNNTIGSWANYWDQQAGDAVGIFIDDVSSWQDHEYAYEVESPRLQVRAYYRDKKLSWQWPLTRGHRSTCLTCYDHAKDKQAMQEQERYTKPTRHNGLTYKVPLSFTSHTLFLENRYGTLNLNRVKDWVLDYPESSRRPRAIFNGGRIKTAAELERDVMTSAFVSTLPVTGTRQMDGHGPIPGRSIVNFSPVPSRQIQGWWIDGFNRVSASMTDRQRTRLTAMYLFIGYVLADEDFMPQVQMLSGHPNYFADVKSVAPTMSFLFPDHPMASVWADMWQKCVALNTRYNTRPTVKTWNADGGRWTEDIGTYVWAFVRPSLRTDFLLRKYDGVQRFATPQLAEMADWLVNVLSAPFAGETKEGFAALMASDHGREWGVVAPGEGPKRVYPPIGAHSEQRMPPRALWYLGTCLHRFNPLAAEHAMWAARPTDQDAETAPGNEPPWDDIMYAVDENRGTNPHLRSRKHTGYGITLRSAVDTPDELSIHLQQIDQGPNYRWGWAGEGGCGLIYFYAAGKSYSFNASEDVGDRRDQDTDFCTNFGVFKNGVFRSIGENVLSRPFYDLGTGQFAEIVPRPVAPHQPAFEYVSRSILLAGNEYFVVYDAVINPSIVHRLSWFVRRGSELPSIQLVHGAASTDRETQRTDHQTEGTTGVWFDGVGDSMAIVSHRKDVRVEGTSFGCRVQVGDAIDLVFRSKTPTHFQDGKYLFDGTSGLIRTTGGKTHYALFHGTRIGVLGFVITTDNTELGIGGSIVAGQQPVGKYFAPTRTTVRISAPLLSDKSIFYVDGATKTSTLEDGALVVELPEGTHHWELTATLPVPVAPRIARTENYSGGATVVIEPVASATRYRIELSRDGGTTWSKNSVKDQPRIELDDLLDGQKVHVRAIAMNSLYESLPGPDYPVYSTSKPPLPPDGLQVELANESATITWGEILGVREYRLYVRAKGETNFQTLYRGTERRFVDKRASIKACNESPGSSIAVTPSNIFEYAIAAANGIGESVMSRTANTDPASWLNWNPRPGERFRRAYNYEPDSPPSSSEFPRYYPE